MGQSLTTWPFEWLCKPPFLRLRVPLLALSTARKKPLSKFFSLEKKIDKTWEVRTEK
jgi:hypothetical protein